MKQGIGLTVLCTFLLSCTPYQHHAEPTRSEFFVKREGGSRVIIFLHGIFGDAKSTWRNVNGAYWPEMIAQDKDFSEYDVYVVNYQAPYFGRASTIGEVATREIRNLKDQDFFKRYHQIFIVAHSMGGLIAKRMLVHLNRPDQARYLHNVKMVTFLSSPTQGTQIAAIASIFSSNPQLAQMDIPEKNEFIATLEEDWQALIRNRNSSEGHFPKVFCAFETLPTYGLLLIGRREAATYCDDDLYPIERNHIEMVKPADPGDSPYPWVKKRILETAVLEDQSKIKATVRAEPTPAPSSKKIPSLTFETDRERQIAIEAIRRDSLERIVSYGETSQWTDVRGKVWSVGDYFKFENELSITPEIIEPSIFGISSKQVMTSCTIPAGESVEIRGFYKEEGKDFAVLRYKNNRRLDEIMNPGKSYPDNSYLNFFSCRDQVIFLHDLQLLP